MDTVKTSLNTDQFIAAFGDHEHVKRFSKEGVSFLLGEMSDFQSTKEKLSSEDFEWLHFFQDAGELTPAELCESHDDEIQERAYQVLCMVNLEVDDLNAETANKIEAFVELKTGDHTESLKLLKEILPDLKASAQWIKALSDFFAEAKGFIELPNGNYITA